MSNYSVIVLYVLKHLFIDSVIRTIVLYKRT